MNMSDLNALSPRSLVQSSSRDSFQDICEHLRWRRQVVESRTRTTQKYHQRTTTKSRKHAPDEKITTVTANRLSMHSCPTSGDASMGGQTGHIQSVGRTSIFCKTDFSGAKAQATRMSNDCSSLTNHKAPPRSDHISSSGRGARKLSNKRWCYSTRSSYYDHAQKDGRRSSKNLSIHEEDLDPSLSITELKGKGRALSYRRSRPLLLACSRSQSPSQRRNAGKRSASCDKAIKQARYDDSQHMANSEFLMKPFHSGKSSSRLICFNNKDGRHKVSRNDQSLRGDRKQAEREQSLANFNLPPKPDSSVKKLSLPAGIQIRAAPNSARYCEDEVIEKFVQQSEKRKGTIAELAKEVNQRSVQIKSFSESPTMRSDKQGNLIEQPNCGTTAEPTEFVKKSSWLRWYNTSTGTDIDSRNDQSLRGDRKQAEREQSLANFNLPPKPDSSVKKLSLPAGIQIRAAPNSARYCEDEVIEKFVQQSEKRKGTIAELAKEVNQRSVQIKSFSESPTMRLDEQGALNLIEQPNFCKRAGFLKENNEEVNPLISNLAAVVAEVPVPKRRNLRNRPGEYVGLREDQGQTTDGSAQTVDDKYWNYGVLPSLIPPHEAATIPGNCDQSKSQDVHQFDPTSHGPTQNPPKYAGRSTKYMDNLDGVAEEQIPLKLPRYFSLAETSKEEQSSVVEPRSSSWKGRWHTKNDASRQSPGDEPPGQTKKVTFANAVSVKASQHDAIYDEDDDDDDSMIDRITYVTDQTSGASSGTYSFVNDALDHVGEKCVDRVWCGP